jgi:transposase InsO family protein
MLSNQLPSLANLLQAYAIFYTLRNLKGILRDRPFTLQTDNRGLRFMRTDTNPMVYRWLVDIQKYDFTLEDILGKDNPLADGFSRLVANNIPSDIIAMLSPPPKIPEQLLILIGKVRNSISGHHGLKRTLRMLTTPSSPDSTVILVDSKTPKLRNHIKQYIATCPCCQIMSMLKLPIHAHPFTTSHYYPMEALNIDFIGPYPDKGYVMSIIDTFTRWVESYYSPAANGKSAAQHLFQHFERFGTPTQLLSDRGSHFVNEVIEGFTYLVETEHCLTLSCSSQQNAIVERVNRLNKEINWHIRALTFESTSVEDYKTNLSIVQRTLNAAYSDRTNMSSS